MGLEASCEIRVVMSNARAARDVAAWRKFKAKCELSGEEIIVRGPEGFRLKLAELLTLEAHSGILAVADSKRQVELVLGKTVAEKWAEKARAPRGRLDKLGIKAKTRVAMIGPVPRDLRDEIMACGAVVVRGGAVDLVLLAAEEPRDLEQLDTLKEWIAPDGGIWIIRRKGSDDLTERQMREAAKNAKLVAIKVAKLSEEHTSDKLVIPRRDRPGR
jgi:hypothetical protein